ncbi:MAG: glycosyltransferase family 4 protein [Holosporaceae bacterium]|jgi:glycosyltransferase involved in cell wall biosynthesis|nr:glycosyltransferase family 4 protein [Holosporaceae bacterium]
MDNTNDKGIIGMENSRQKLKQRVLALITFMVAFITILAFFLFLMLVCTFKSKISDVFTTERISSLNPRPREFTRDVVVSLMFIGSSGGVATLTENILQGMIVRRTNWRFILLIRKDVTNPIFKRLATFKNVKMIEVDVSCYNYGLDEFLHSMFQKINNKRIKDRLIQLVFYDQLFLDHKCDVFWDPEAGLGWFNDFFAVAKISSIHDLAYHDTNCFPPEKAKWAEFRTNALVKNSKKIITVSDFSRKRVVDVFKLDPNSVRAIPIQMANRLNGGIKLTSREIKAILSKYHLTPQNYFIYLSHYWPNKNHKRLLLAFEKYVKGTKSDLKLILVGAGSSTIDSYRKMVREKQMEDRVIFSGFMSKENLQVVLANALAFIHPSIYEGFGMPIIEAMAAGVPVACSTAGSLPEVAGNAALFFNPINVDEIEKAIATMVSDGNLRKTLVERGYRQAEKFANNSAMIDRYIQVFEEVMSESDRAKQGE